MFTQIGTMAEILEKAVAKNDGYLCRYLFLICYSFLLVVLLMHIIYMILYPQCTLVITANYTSAFKKVEMKGLTQIESRQSNISFVAVRLYDENMFLTTTFWATTICV